MPPHLRRLSRDHLEFNNLFLQERLFVVHRRTIHLDHGPSHGIAVDIHLSRLPVDYYNARKSMIKHDQPWSPASSRVHNITEGLSPHLDYRRLFGNGAGNESTVETRRLHERGQ